MAYDNTNSGVLFVKKDRKNDKQPNFEGRINVNGKDYELAAWTKVSKAGDKFISLQIREPRAKGQAPKADISSIPDEIGF